MTDSPYDNPRVASVYERVAAPIQFAPPARDLIALVRPSDYLLSREASVQGLVLCQALPSERRNALTRRLAEAFDSRFGDTVTYIRDVHFGVGTRPLT